MRYFEVGQIVWCAIWGKGIVKSINNTDNPQYPIVVHFNPPAFGEYTIDGRYFESGRITLSHTPIPEIVNQPLPEFNLSYAEALKEVMINNKKITCELWDKSVYIYLKDNHIVIQCGSIRCNYNISKNEFEAKWKIID